MKKPEELTSYDFYDRIQVPDGYDLITIPDLTRDNFQTLINEHNNLVECFNKLCDIKQITFYEEVEGLERTEKYGQWFDGFEEE